MLHSDSHRVFGKAFGKLLNAALVDGDGNTIEALLWAINANGRAWARAVVAEETKDPVDLFDDLVDKPELDCGW